MPPARQPHALDSRGNLYGAGLFGGVANLGVVFKLDSSASYSVLYSFSGGSDGAHPNSPVTLDTAGNIYGTTTRGGEYDNGVVYKIDPQGRASILYILGNGDQPPDTPTALALDAHGNLYGISALGGAANAGLIFKLGTSGKATILYSFTGGTNGFLPSGLVVDGAGNLYGTADGGTQNEGLVFKLDPAGNETTFYNFTGGVDGGGAQGLVLDTAGDLYGSAAGGSSSCNGGKDYCGVLFKLDPAGNYTVLYSFTGGASGSAPLGPPTLGPEGNLYGVTFDGGAICNDCGVIYKVDANGNESVIHSFGQEFPNGGLVFDTAGNLYGTTQNDVYQIDPAGNERVLLTSSATAGSGLQGGIAMDAAGNLYGAASAGGRKEQGLVFKLTGLPTAWVR